MKLSYTTQPDPDWAGLVRHVWTLTTPDGLKYTYGALIDAVCVDLEAELEYHEKEAAKVIGGML